MQELLTSRDALLAPSTVSRRPLRNTWYGRILQKGMGVADNTGRRVQSFSDC